MTKKTMTIGSDTWEWEETPEAKAAIAKLHRKTQLSVFTKIFVNLN